MLITYMIHQKSEESEIVPRISWNRWEECQSKWCSVAMTPIQGCKSYFKPQKADPSSIHYITELNIVSEAEVSNTEDLMNADH